MLVLEEASYVRAMSSTSALLVLGAGLVPTSAPQQSVTLHGHLLDAVGTPVAGGEVSVACQGEYPVFGDIDLIARSTSGPDGQFELEIGPEWLERHESFRALWVAACAPGHGVFAATWNPEDFPAGQSLALPLPELDTFDVRVVDEMGEPVEGARVAPSQLNRSEAWGARLHETFSLACAVVTNADGRAALPVPMEETREIKVWADRRPAQTFRGLRQGDRLDSELRLTGGSDVPVTLEDVEVSGVHLKMRANSSYESSSGAPIARYVSEVIALDEEDRTVWIPDGTYQLNLHSEDARSLTLDVLDESTFADDSQDFPPARITIRASDEQYSWSGTVVDSSGNPAGGVRLHVYARNRGRVFTDAEGRFEFPCSMRGGVLNFVEGNADFVAPSSIRGFTATAPNSSTNCVFEPIEVHACRRLRVEIVDPSGVPEAGAFVVVRQKIPRARGGMTTRVMTAISGSDGTCEVPGAITGHPLEIDATSGAHHGSVALDANASEARLALSPALRLGGRVTKTPDGEPVIGARLTLDALPERRPRTSIASGGSRVVFSRANGAFEFQAPLDPDELYVLGWESTLTARGQTEPMTGAEIAGLGTIELLSLRTVTVQIVDAAGAPEEGATAWLRSSTHRAKVDEHGTAKLIGGEPMDDVLIVRTQLGQWRAQAIPAEVDTIRCTVGDEWPLETFNGRERDRAAERQLAADLARLELATYIEADDMARALRAVRRLSWSDPLDVLRRLDGGLFGATYRSDWSVSYVAEALTKTSPDEALSVAQRLVPDLSRVMRVLEAARELPRLAEFELLALERASLSAIASPEERLVALAKLCDRFVELGRTDVAMPLFAEGEQLAETLATSDWAGYARANFGEALALVDQGAGLAMIRSMEGDGDLNRHYGNVAHRLASTDPKSAEEWLDRCERATGSFRADRFISRVAYHMAPLDVERATRLAERFDRRGFSHGMIALALHEAGRPAAVTVPILDEAFSHVEALGKTKRREWLERPLRVAGALLPVAAAVNPERFRRLARARAGGHRRIDEDPRSRGSQQVGPHRDGESRVLRRALRQGNRSSAHRTMPGPAGGEWRGAHLFRVPSCVGGARRHRSRRGQPPRPRGRITCDGRRCGGSRTERWTAHLSRADGVAQSLGTWQARSLSLRTECVPQDPSQ